ncbi:MAG: T9SS type A sorting domain-containing protein [Bacteroidota bacterium]
MKKRIILSFLLLTSLCKADLLHAQYISTVVGNGVGAGTGTGTYTGDGGLAINAGLFGLTTIAFDAAGNMYIADQNNNAVRKVNTSGVITTIAGKGVAGYSGDDTLGVAAMLNKPYGVAVDYMGNVYISDNGNNVIRKVNSAGIITTFAGTGVAGYSGDMGPANMARLKGPQGLAVDGSGNLYIADADNHVVRKISTTGAIATIAGTGTPGYSGNGGPATAAALHYPTAVAFDIFGNLYITDYLNNVVRKVSTSGTITTVAGTGVMGLSGDGGAATAAKLHYPSGVSIDGARNVYIADQGNNAVRRVDSNGIITNFAGTHTNGYTGNGGLATNAQLSSPKSVHADGWGRVYIVDYDNNVVRVVASSATINGVSSVTATPAIVYPNPSADGTFTIRMQQHGSYTATLTDVLGNVITTVEGDGTTATINGGQLPSGNYFISVASASGVYRTQVAVIR